MKEVINGIVITIEETKSSYVLKIFHNNRSITVDRFNKNKEGAYQNALYYFKKIKEELKEKIREKGVNLALVEFL
jgi:hypothetical protein